MRAALAAIVLTAGCAASSTGAAEPPSVPVVASPSVAAVAPSKPAAVKPKPVPAARTFPNCTELRKAYPGGVAKPGAVNRGEALTTHPKTDVALYTANESSDRDGDGLACES